MIHLANVTLAALAAALWTAVLTLPEPATGVEIVPQQPTQARYCVVPGTNMAALCRDVFAEMEV